jgi:hypothetical protein
MPCDEPAGWTVIDQHGGACVMCDGNVYDAVRRIEGVRISILDTSHTGWIGEKMQHERL